MDVYTGNILSTFHGNILSLSENIAKSFTGGYFLTHSVDESLFAGLFPMLCGQQSYEGKGGRCAVRIHVSFQKSAPYQLVWIFF